MNKSRVKHCIATFFGVSIAVIWLQELTCPAKASGPRPFAERQELWFSGSGQIARVCRYPIRVFVSQNLRRHEDVVEDAMEWWNEKLGDKIFIMQKESMFSDVDVESIPANDRSLGLAMLIPVAGCASSAIVGLVAEVLDKTDYITRKRIISHELGHLLGLNDTQDNRELMCFRVNIPAPSNGLVPLDAVNVVMALYKEQKKHDLGTGVE